MRVIERNWTVALAVCLDWRCDMDPEATWKRMLEAWKDQRWEELQEAATDLKDWLSRGGCPPQVPAGCDMGVLWNGAVTRAACEFAINICWRVLQSPDRIPQGIPFSVSCYECDAGSPSSHEAALASGWTGIDFRPDLPAENFLGYCPDHVPEPPWVE